MEFEGNTSFTNLFSCCSNAVRQSCNNNFCGSQILCSNMSYHIGQVDGKKLLGREIKQATYWGLSICQKVNANLYIGVVQE